MKRFLLFFGVAVLLFAGARVYYTLTEDFRYGAITHDIPPDPAWVIEEPTGAERELVDGILAQEFTYLGKGAQSYAFVSADDRYVLKFFKSKHSRPSIFLEMLPPIGFLADYKEQKREQKRQKLFKALNGYKLAYDVHRDESALVYIHLVPTDYLDGTLRLRDKLGLSWEFDLDSTVFIIQKKGTKLRNRVIALLDAGKVDETKQKVGEIIDLYRAEYAKGIYDTDHGVMHNTGFIGEQPVHLDVGKLTRAPQMQQTEVANRDLEAVVDKFRVYFADKYPQHADELETALIVQ